jgi:UDP-3-O-[3-hydroxymyristoyl] glucosamine N-acyltransferase
MSPANVLHSFTSEQIWQSEAWQKCLQSSEYNVFSSAREKTAKAIQEPRSFSQYIWQGFASLHIASSQQISFAADATPINKIIASLAGCIIISEKKYASLQKDYSDLLQEKQQAGLWIITDNAYHHFVQILTFFMQNVSLNKRGSVHPDAKIHPSAVVEGSVGAGAHIGAQCVIEAGAVVGADCILEPGVVLHSEVLLGERTHIFANSVVGQRGFGFYEYAGRQWRVPHYGGVCVGDDTEIGVQASVAAGFLEPTQIGDSCHLDSQVHIGHNCQLGNHVYMVAQSGLAGRVVLEDGVQIGGGAKVDNAVHIGKGARIAALSGVTKDVPPHKTYAGFPARPIAQWRRSLLSKASNENKE